MSETKEGRKPSLLEAIVVLLFAAALIGSGVLIWEVDVHIPIAISAAFAAAVSIFLLKYKWNEVEEGILNGIMMGMQANLILYTVGMMVGIWILSGVVPSMISFGLDILSPSIFLFATLIICSIVSLSTGSSWGTSGTVGIALMGIASGLGIPPALTAGVVLSGAYFGDKMSPLSDTTNLAPAVAGTDLFQHIRAMAWTTGPSYVLVAVITLVLGMRYSSGTLDVEKIGAIQSIMGGEFSISLLGFIPPIIVIGLAAAKMPAIPGLFAGVLAGCAMAFLQGLHPGDILNALQNGYEPSFAQTIADGETAAAVTQVLAEKGLTLNPDLAKEVGGSLVELLARGGMQSMNWTISLILCAFTFGGVLERCGFLEVLLHAALKPVKSVTGLVFATFVACFGTNLFLGDQYLSIVMPGRMFKPAYDERGLHGRMLSRSLEDFGTITSVLIPWNTCGAYNSTVLGVPTVEYLPYAFLNYLNPIVSVGMTALGIGISWKGKDGEVVIARSRPNE